MRGEQQSYFGLALVPAVVGARAASIIFHPSERKRVLPDGHLELMLCCRGELELLAPGIGWERLMFNKITTPKVVCTSLAFLIFGACQMSIPMTGQTNTGQAASGTVIADMSENNTLQINVGQSMVCRGLYNANNRSNVAVTCGNGVSGTAVVKPDADDLGGVVDFKLSDGTSGQVATNRAANSVRKPSVDDKNQEPVQQAQQPSPRKTSIFVGILPQYETSTEGKGYKVDVFRYFCQVTVAYKNTSSSVKAPQFKILFTNGNQTVGESLVLMPSTLPGGESKAFGNDVCQGSPSYIMFGGI